MNHLDPVTSRKLESLCTEISMLFKEEEGMKLTLILRNPSRKDADVLVSNDSIDLAFDAARKLDVQSSSTEAGPPPTKTKD